MTDRPESVRCEGGDYRRDPDYDDHDGDVFLLLWQHGTSHFRAFRTHAEAINHGVRVEHQVFERADGIADFAPAAVVSRDGTVLHRWDRWP